MRRISLSRIDKKYLIPLLVTTVVFGIYLYMVIASIHW